MISAWFKINNLTIWGFEYFLIFITILFLRLFMKLRMKKVNDLGIFADIMDEYNTRGGGGVSFPSYYSVKIRSLQC